MSKLNPFAGSNKGFSWFWWGITFGIFWVVMVWWWLEKQPKPMAGNKVNVKPLILPEEEPEIPLPVRVKKPRVPKKPDDLQVIEGIGPRSAQVLTEAGVTTFARLAAMEPDAIQAILRAAGVRVPYPGTWPEQAALAASGSWEVLEELQRNLKGGRRV
jgi:predicted flap endonuclease-1-like 5' DNA nuclease